MGSLVIAYSDILQSEKNFKKSIFLVNFINVANWYLKRALVDFMFSGKMVCKLEVLCFCFYKALYDVFASSHAYKLNSIKCPQTILKSIFHFLRICSLIHSQKMLQM